MESSNPQEAGWLKRAGVAVIILMGIISFSWLMVTFFRESQIVEAMPEQELRAVLKQSEEIDRANWERMWQQAGREAPAPPAKFYPDKQFPPVE